MEKFRKLGLNEEIIKQIVEYKFEKPTEIQEKTIPLVVSGKDVIAGAATGSGKTLIFGAGIIQNCEKQGVIQALVLVPTRELANQVAKTLKMFSKYKPFDIVEIYGGVSISPQIQKLKKADVVVGTPGRILDHLERRTLELEYVKILVLDEADRMLDMGFIDDVKRIIEHCPKKRQTLLFSATILPEISKIAENYMQHPVKVSAESYVDPSKLKQIFYNVPDNMKFSLLVHLLKKEHSGLVMVFCNTQRNTDFVAKNLQDNGINALAIHGGLSQDKRNKVMGQFHAQNVFVLVCTDVAARGLDIKGVSHVYNYDIPNESNQYIHRIGRTARAGKDGIAVNILASRDYDNFAEIRRHYAEFKIEREELPEIARVFIQFKDAGRRGRFGRFPQRRRGRFGFRNSEDRNEGFREKNRGGGFGRSAGFRGGSSGGEGRFRRNSGGSRRDNKFSRGDGDSQGSSRGFGSRRDNRSSRRDMRESRNRFHNRRRY